MDGRIFNIKQKLSNDLGHHWSVCEMAETVDISEPHFIRLFRRCLDATPADYLTSLRMERAQTLLETTFIRVKEIAVRIGIPNESQFTREFKKRFGSTPTQHRRQYWESEQSAPPVAQESSPEQRNSALRAEMIIDFD